MPDQNKDNETLPCKQTATGAALPFLTLLRIGKGLPDSILAITAISIFQMANCLTRRQKGDFF
jgi:hypothetical protein